MGIDIEEITTFINFGLIYYNKERPFQSDNEFAEVGRGKLNLLVDAQCARRRFVQASRLAQQRVPELDELDDIACEGECSQSFHAQ
jgi:hypothetical protein